MANYTRALELAQKLPGPAEEEPQSRRLQATTMLDLASVEHSRGNFRESKQNAEAAADIFRELIKLPPEKSQQYDPLWLGAAHTRIAVADRDQGLIKEARSMHNAAIKMLQEMAAKSPGQVVRADILHHLARARFEQARTLAKVPDKRAIAETNIGAAATQWEKLAMQYPMLPLYSASQADALVGFAEIRMEGERPADARAEFRKAQALLEALVKKHPETPAYRANLGRTYAGLGRLDTLEGNHANARLRLSQAIEALTQAAEQSPDSVRIRQWRDEARAEQAK